MIQGHEIKLALDGSCKNCLDFLPGGVKAYWLVDSDGGHKSMLLCPLCYAKYEASTLDVGAFLGLPKPPKKYMLVTTEYDDGNPGTHTQTLRGLTEAEAYRIVLDAEAALNHWEHFSYEVYEDISELSFKLGWEARLAEDVPKRKAEIEAEIHRRHVLKIKENEERLARDQEAKDKAEYARLKAKFEGDKP